MPEYSSEERNGHLRTTVKINPGERIKLCRCLKSKEFPFCDGIHNTMEGAIGPVIIECLACECAEKNNLSS